MRDPGIPVWALSVTLLIYCAIQKIISVFTEPRYFLPSTKAFCLPCVHILITLPIMFPYNLHQKASTVIHTFVWKDQHVTTSFKLVHTSNQTQDHSGMARLWIVFTVPSPQAPTKYNLVVEGRYHFVQKTIHLILSKKPQLTCLHDAHKGHWTDSWIVYTVVSPLPVFHLWTKWTSDSASLSTLSGHVMMTGWKMLYIMKSLFIFFSRHLCNHPVTPATDL